MKTDDIQSSKSGIAGTMIKKVAAKKVAASLADAEAQAREMAIKRIEGEVAVEVGKRLEALNRSYRKLRPAVALVCADAAPCRLVLHKGALLISSQPARQELHQLPDSVHHAELLVSAPMKDTALAKKLEDAKSSLKEPTAVKHDESWLVVGIGLR
jgi:hypothetical protein